MLLCWARSSGSGWNCPPGGAIGSNPQPDPNLVIVAPPVVSLPIPDSVVVIAFPNRRPLSKQIPQSLSLFVYTCLVSVWVAAAGGGHAC